MRRLLPLRVMLPLVLGVVVSLSILGFAELGYRRLEFANRAMATALETESAVNETLALVSDAETSQRGYLLTGASRGLGFATARALVDDGALHSR